MKTKQQYSQSENYEDFISRARHLRRIRLGYTPAVFPYCYEFEERKSAAWNMLSAVPLFLLFYVEKGLNIINIGNEEFRIEPNSFLIIPQECGFTSHTFGHTIRHVLEFQGELMKHMEISQGLNHPMLLNLKDDPEIAELITSIGPLVDTENINEFCSIMGKTYELLGRLSCLIHKHGRKKTIVQDVLFALEEEGTEKKTMNRLTKKLGISQSSIYRTVKKQVGMSPKEFCIVSRMKKAICLLEYSKKSIKEIAFSLGYCNQYYFSSDFKRIVGRTPTEYRNHIKNMPYQRERNDTFPFQNYFGEKTHVFPR